MTQKEQIQQEIADRQSWLEIIEANQNGGKLQLKKPDGNWVNVMRPNNLISFGEYIYRIKPKPRELWVNEYNNALSVAYHATQESAANACQVSGKSIKFVEVME